MSERDDYADPEPPDRSRLITYLAVVGAVLLLTAVYLFGEVVKVRE